LETESVRVSQLPKRHRDQSPQGKLLEPQPYVQPQNLNLPISPAPQRHISTILPPLHSFLSSHFQALALPRLERSQVIGENQKGVTDDVRTSYDCFIDRRYDAIVSKIEDRVANWARIPVNHQEELSILKYEIGQEYQAHWDEDDPTTQPEITGGEDNYRIATVLMYLEGKFWTAIIITLTR